MNTLALWTPWSFCLRRNPEQFRTPVILRSAATKDLPEVQTSGRSFASLRMTGSIMSDPHHLRRVDFADQVNLVFSQTERPHVAAHQTDALHGVRKQRLAGVA